MLGKELVSRRKRLSAAGMLPVGAICIVPLCLALGGCNSDSSPLVQPPVRPASLSIARSPAQRIEDSEHAQLVASFGGEYRAPAARQLLEEIAARIVAASERGGAGYQITILNSSTVNAFALPSGRLYVTRGLLALANDTAEVASVLAHEIAHVTARHAAARDELKQESALLESVETDLLRNNVQGSLLQARSQISIARFSRQQELEADQIGVRTAAKAGFDAFGAVRFLTALGRQGASTSAGQKRSLEFLASHPSTPERIAQAQAAARQIGAPGIGERDAARWLAAIDGIAFGDDPGQGIVRGRRYLNTRLGITFTAPEGFQLEADGDTVVAFTSDSSQAIRFDSVAPQPGQTLENYVGSEWIAGVKAGSIETTTAGGYPTAVTSGRGTNWNFRLAAIQAGNRIYRIIVAGQGNGNVERPMKAMLDGFRPVNAAEQQVAGMPRIVIVPAGEQDTVAALSGRMNQEQPLEKFLLLNGLDASSGIVPGQRYKIVSR
jgi:predicted Zn-dependent protease